MAFVSKNKSLVLKETFKRQEKVITGMPAEPRSICGTVVSSSPLWCNISIATTSAAVMVRGDAGWGGGPKDIRCSGSEQTSRLAQAPRTWNYVGGGGVSCRAWTAVYGARVAPPRSDWFPLAARDLLAISLITKSGPHRGSECWPLLPTGEGHWTRFCKDSRAKLKIR